MRLSVFFYRNLRRRYWGMLLVLLVGADPAHRCWSKKIFGGAKEFCWDSPKLARNIVQKKLIMSIRAPLFSNQSMLGAIFAQIFREF